ncbi:MAG: hypothetical protein CMI54_04610 [Parcubacteria group bacterium]|nr:hypothetical protein [Parcubacteria group bacterium]|tara:strand:- start:15716 stop:15973 length:258 start_codon:yes stop_codon:yes gene_type:complete
MNEIYIVEKQPETRQEAAQLIHNLNIDIIRDLKKEKIEDGWIWTNLQISPFKYAAQYVEDNAGINVQDNEALIPIAGFIDYMRMH